MDRNVLFNSMSSHNYVPNANLLGLKLDSALSCSSHVENVSKIFSQNIGILRKFGVYFPMKQRRLYCESMIRPVLNYVAVVWTNGKNDLLGRVLK